MGLGQKFLPMEIVTMESIKLGDFMEKENTFGQMVLPTMVISPKVTDKEKENGNPARKEEINMWVSTKRTRSQGRENIHG